MSGALTIAAITSVLKDLLDNRLAQRGVSEEIGDIKVTALPPDRIAVGADERTQLNVFMYRMTPHAAYRDQRKERSNGHGQPPLCVDLHYLFTAYGEEDLHAEILLGHTVQFLHETPTLSRDTIEATLRAGSDGAHNSPSRAAVAGVKLADQFDLVALRPEFLNMEETTKLWSALQAHYRPSAGYEVSAILIQSQPETPA